MALFLFVTQLPCMLHNTLVRHAYFSRPSSGEVKCFSDGVVFACHAALLYVTEILLIPGLERNTALRVTRKGRDEPAAYWAFAFLKFNFIAFETKYKDSSTICTW